MFCDFFSTFFYVKLCKCTVKNQFAKTSNVAQLEPYMNLMKLINFFLVKKLTMEKGKIFSLNFFLKTLLLIV
jgi:hypothetical protein